jgi:hypothetical protein
MRSNNTTEALAARLGIKPQSIRARLCRTGSYFGEKPHKLPNGWLWWADGAFERIAFGQGKNISAVESQHTEGRNAL